MTARKHTPLHDFWHRRVEGQIRDAMHSHPEWFNVKSERQKRTLVNSLAKRIVGEIVAAGVVAAERAGVNAPCPRASGSGGGSDLPPDGREVVSFCLPSEDPNDAEARFRKRFEADKADELSDEAWGDWVNNLPQDEFWAMVKFCMADGRP